MKVKNRQLYSNECGVYAALNLLNLYQIKGKKEDVDYNQKGCSVENLCIYLKKYFYKVKAIKFQLSSLKRINQITPFIALIQKENISHYVVIYKKNKKYLYILDSLAKKSYKISYELFEKISGKIYIICEECKQIKIHFKTIKETFLLPLLSFLESIFLMATTIILQQIIDYGYKDAILYILVQLFVLAITTYKIKIFLKTFKILDKDIVLQTMKGIYSLNPTYLLKHHIDEVYYRVFDAYTYKNMILSFLYNVINDVILAICSIVLMFVYSYRLALIILLMCVFVVLFSVKMFHQLKEVVEEKRIKEFQFINDYRDSFNNEKTTDSQKEINYYKSQKNLEEYQKKSYLEEKLKMKKDVILLYFQTTMITIVVVLYFTKFYEMISIGSLVALINLLTLVLQPILNLCSQLTDFSNFKLIRKRLKDIEENTKMD